MTSQHGYSLRKLAQKLGKDKGYIENRLRLADAPPEIRELVSVRSDTLSAAYELMKVSDPRKRRRLAAQVATGELSLARLRLRVEGRAEVATAPSPAPTDDSVEETAMEAVMGADVEQPAAATGSLSPVAAPESAAAVGVEATRGAVEAAPGGVEAAPGEVETAPGGVGPAPVAIAIEPEGPAVDAPHHAVALVDIDQAARQLSHAVDELVAALLGDASLAEASSADRQLFAKYLTINKVKLENAIAVVRVAGTRTSVPVHEPRD
jgi:hypothetical protein